MGGKDTVDKVKLIFLTFFLFRPFPPFPPLALVLQFDQPVTNGNPLNPSSVGQNIRITEPIRHSAPNTSRIATMCGAPLPFYYITCEIHPLFRQQCIASLPEIHQHMRTRA